MTARLGEFTASTARIDNRAVFEIPGIMEQILKASRAGVPAPPARVPRETDPARRRSALH
jgi:hypothetical protein